MSVLQRVVKPKTRRGKRFLESREPKLVENDKRAIFIKGLNANNTVTQVMKDFVILKKPHSVMFGKKNDIKPFEDVSSLEFFSKKSDASLFMFGSNNKKRPNNLVIGRLFNYNILDMFEFGVENFKSLKEYKTEKVTEGTKPMLLFIGEEFEQEYNFKRVKNLFIDFFRGPVVQCIHLQGLEHLLVFSISSGKILLRSFRVLMKKSESKVPRIELEEIGPHMDFTLRRMKLASDDLLKHACKKPLQLKPKTVKNIKKDPLGTTHGRIHMQRQDYSKLQLRKMKGLKRKLAEKKSVSVQDKKLKTNNTSSHHPDSKLIKTE